MEKGWVIVVRAVNVCKCECCLINRCINNDESSLWVSNG